MTSIGTLGITCTRSTVVRSLRLAEGHLLERGAATGEAVAVIRRVHADGEDFGRTIRSQDHCTNQAWNRQQRERNTLRTYRTYSNAEDRRTLTSLPTVAFGSLLIAHRCDKGKLSK